MQYIFALVFALIFANSAIAQSKFVSPQHDFSIVLPAQLQKVPSNPHQYQAVDHGRRYMIGSCKVFKNNTEKNFESFKWGIESNGWILKNKVDKNGPGWKGQLCSFAASGQEMTSLYAAVDGENIVYTVAMDLPNSSRDVIDIVNSFTVNPKESALAHRDENDPQSSTNSQAFNLGKSVGQWLTAIFFISVLAITIYRLRRSQPAK
jgi:hypothetical protein